MDNRRIGKRIQVSVPAVWEPMSPLRPKGLWFRRAVGAETVAVVDLSVTGAGVIAPRQPLLVPGLMMVMTFEHGRAVVRIRQVTARDASSTYFGVSFVEMAERLREAVNNTIGGSRREFDWRWTIAR
jgi:hypothetical protein